MNSVYMSHPNPRGQKREKRMSQHPNTLTLILSFLFFFLSSTCPADKPNKFHDLPFDTCTGNSTYGGSTLFQRNLDSLFTYLKSNASITKFNSTTYGNGTDKVYGQYMCLKYDIIKQQKCQTCVTRASKDIILKCPSYTEALVWEEECNLMYSNLIIIDHLNFSGNMWKCNELNISQPQEFKKLVNETLRDLTKAAASVPSSGMYTKTKREFKDKEKETLYGAVQCGDNLSSDECNTCLLKAIDDVLENCLSSVGARLLSRDCYLRYELYAFYDGKTGPADTGDDSTGSGIKTVLLIVVLSVVSSTLALVILGCCIYNRNFLRRDRRGTKISPIMFGSLNKTTHTKSQDSPFMDLPTICSATNFFSASNKLGQGGFGPVYKGILSDGKEVAIKRLSINSEQGIEEFTNEVLLIMKLQHKNLVKLLGFCAYEMEKILVYEYMPNGSLDLVLFDPKRRAGLDWSKRLNIIDGIARGVLYLHEDSRLKIIHRDLKASNILLDSEMNPKISDFGMARIFAETDAAANTTTIVGTYGYMAPEYAMEGLYSKKSDVFSFGVLLLEIITGKMNASFHLSKRAPTLQAYAWQLFNEGSELELLDPLIGDLCHPNEFKRYMHIGLLCVQEDSYDRPTMSAVVVMMKSESTALKTPTKPAFSVGTHSSLHGDTDAVNHMANSEIFPR